MPEHPIALAYRAHRYVPEQDYRHGRRRKMYNPIRTTPALVVAMTHLGRSAMGLPEARRQARRAVQEPRAAAQIDDLDWDGLLEFLDTIALFLKAGPQQRKERGMRTFEPRDPQHKTALKSKEVTPRARKLADEQLCGAAQQRGDVVLNKLKKMGAHVTAAADQWAALAALARFYPRRGIPAGYVDALVQELETTQLDSFKQLVAQSLIFYEADEIKQRRQS